MIDLEPIRAAVNIVEYIGQCIRLKKRGPEWWGCCPFHQERTASFHVHPEKGTYMCFGCHVNGDIFRFVERIEGVSFPKAVRIVAEYAGIELDDQKLTRAERRQRSAQRREAQAVAEDAAQWLVELRRWLRSYSRRVNRLFREWEALANETDRDILVQVLELGPAVHNLRWKAEELREFNSALLEASPDELIHLYSVHRSKHPLTAKIVQARLTRDQEDRAFCSAIVSALFPEEVTS